MASFPDSHAYWRKANGAPGEGQLWNTSYRCWVEPYLAEKEHMMGYLAGSTMGGVATNAQRAARLGQAKDGNSMRWWGGFLSDAIQRDLP